MSHRILVVEDNEVNLALILAMLSNQGHEVTVARNGQEAIDLAQSHRPELILMDITDACDGWIGGDAAVTCYT